ncbi:NAD(P)H-dependent oxidoreductase [Streptomyces europaeiscabiei]|uniref:NADPH-dependent FMN reductase n=1 Tax=Streptomyces europaeiscabiei TaxID=146819 RepID=UPI002E18CF7F
MPDQPVRLAVIMGSARPERLSATVADWFVGQARRRSDVELDIIDLADVSLAMDGPILTPAPRAKEELAITSPRLAKAEAFVVVTPEYNHSFPAVLKNFIDWHLTEWMAKPVGFVSHGGGVGGGLRAVEQLRQVFAELHAVTVRDTVSFHGGRAAFDEDGNPLDNDGCGAAAKTMLDQILWWATALREAKALRPYSV